MMNCIKVNQKDLEMIKTFFEENRIEYQELTANPYKNICILEAEIQLNDYLDELGFKNEDIKNDLKNRLC